jgi:hypothetical protein
MCMWLLNFLKYNDKKKYWQMQFFPNIFNYSWLNLLKDTLSTDMKWQL